VPLAAATTAATTAAMSAFFMTWNPFPLYPLPLEVGRATGRFRLVPI
jgi:hypothetical protein